MAVDGLLMPVYRHVVFGPVLIHYPLMREANQGIFVDTDCSPPL